jgi:hypothetical protein
VQWSTLGRCAVKVICTQIEIQAPVERVWQLLTDFTAFPHWDPSALIFVLSYCGDNPVCRYEYESTSLNWPC